jgi:2-amino-4-hydroxy-6-hydroxymethyldihydropteridine diphosphokinase
MKTVYLAIGTNIGDRESNLAKAVAMVEEHIGPVKHASSVYETEPWGFHSENYFLNMVIEVEASLRPSGLLGRILMIESFLGRLREGKEYKSRIIDIDILLYDKRIIKTKVLVIPHPRMHERRFVLIPLSEITEDLIHPVLCKSIRELLDECPDKSKVKPYNNPLSAKL